MSSNLTTFTAALGVIRARRREDVRRGLPFSASTNENGAHRPCDCEGVFAERVARRL